MEEGDVEGFVGFGVGRRGRGEWRGKYGVCAESREAACGVDVGFELYGEYGVSGTDDAVEGMFSPPISD
jgi:hypothetical protein